MDIPKWNRVYVKAPEPGVKINPDFVYMSIPREYMCTYIRLLNMVSDIGKRLLDDCNATCKGDGKNVMNCWNMFQSAIACYNIGKAKEANFLINYIEKQVYNLYSTMGISYNQSFEIPVTEDGTVKALCTCGEEIKIVIDEKDNAAYEDYVLHKDDGKVFVKDED